MPSLPQPAESRAKDHLNLPIKLEIVTKIFQVHYAGQPVPLANRAMFLLAIVVFRLAETDVLNFAESLLDKKKYFPKFANFSENMRWSWQKLHSKIDDSHLRKVRKCRLSKFKICSTKYKRRTLHLLDLVNMTFVGISVSPILRE